MCTFFFLGCHLKFYVCPGMLAASSSSCWMLIFCYVYIVDCDNISPIDLGGKFFNGIKLLLLSFCSDLFGSIEIYVRSGVSLNA